MAALAEGQLPPGSRGQTWHFPSTFIAKCGAGPPRGPPAIPFKSVDRCAAGTAVPPQLSGAEGGGFCAGRGCQGRAAAGNLLPAAHFVPPAEQRRQGQICTASDRCAAHLFRGSCSGRSRIAKLPGLPRRLSVKGRELSAGTSSFCGWLLWHHSVCMTGRHCRVYRSFS